VIAKLPADPAALRVYWALRMQVIKASSPQPTPERHCGDGIISVDGVLIKRGCRIEILDPEGWYSGWWEIRFVSTTKPDGVYISAERLTAKRGRSPGFGQFITVLQRCRFKALP
jgi:hypothetical protein